MKILLINDNISRDGGAEIYNQRLKNWLEERGHIVKLFGGRLPDESEVAGYIKSWYNPSSKERIQTTLEKFRPDVVQCHNLFEYISPSILGEINKRGIPISMKIGDTRLLYPFFQRRIPRRKSLLRYVHPFLYATKIPLHRHLIRKHVDVFVAQSEYTRQQFTEYANFRPMRIIQNPIPWETADIIKSDSDTVLYVGSIEDDKGIDVLLGASDIVIDAYPDVTIKLIGEEKQDYRSGLSPKLRERIEFKGYIDNELEIQKAFQDAAVSVLPSTIAETSGLVIIESMSQGTPVVTTNIGGQKENVRDGETGYLVPPGNERALARRLLDLLKNDSKRQHMSNESVESAERQSKENHVDQVESLFNNLASSNNE